MTETQSRTVEEQELESGLFQLRYLNEDNSLSEISAAELSDALSGVVELTSQMHKAGLFGNAVPPEVKARPAERGSFVLTTVIEFISSDPLIVGALYSTAGSALLLVVNAGIKLLRGVKVRGQVTTDHGTVIVTWEDGSFEELPMSAWRKLERMPNQTKKAFRKLMAPLSDEATTVELRDGTVDRDSQELSQQPARATATRSDYRAAAYEEEAEEPEVDHFEAEAQFVNVDFEDGERWRIKTRRGERKVVIEDQDFLRRVSRNEPISKDNIYRVEIREESTVSNGRRSTVWALESVELVREGSRDDS